MDLPVSERQITWLDHVRLFNLVSVPRPGPRPSVDAAERTRDVLDMAEIVAPEAVAPDVVTMRSRVRLSRGGCAAMEVTLAYPAETGAGDGCISVFSPLGLALLGARAGDRVEWCGPDGEAHRATVDAVLYQPEAAGELTR